jgi:zinc protease
MSKTSFITHFLSAATLLFLFSFSSHASPPPNTLAPQSVTVPQLPLIHTTILKNGMRLMVVENPRAPVVLHTVTYKVGSIDEKPEEHGLAHLLEHIRHRGTSKRSEETIETLLETIGGVYNASTGNDFTQYYQRIQPQHLDKVMELEAERLQFLVIDPKKFKSEKKIVTEERNLRVDNEPQSLFYEEFRNLIFRVHPYRNPTIGFDADIQELSLEKTINFHDRYYQPHNAMISVVGDVSFPHVLALAEKYYGNIPPTQKNQNQKTHSKYDPTLFEPPARAPTFHITHQEKIYAPSINLSWKTTSLTDNPSLFPPDDYRHIFLKKFNNKISPSQVALSLSILSEILTNESFSFFKTFVHETQYAHSVSASYNPWKRGPTLFYIQAENIDNTKNVEELSQTLLQFLKNPSFISKQNLQDAKNSILLSFAYSFDDLESLDSMLTKLFIHNKTPQEFQNLIQELNNIRLEHIHTVAKTLFHEHPFVNLEKPSPPS